MKEIKLCSTCSLESPLKSPPTALHAASSFPLPHPASSCSPSHTRLMADSAQARPEGTRVVLRVRPFNAREAGTRSCLECLPGSVQLTGQESRQFSFDRVYAPSATQAEASGLQGPATQQGCIAGRSSRGLDQHPSPLPTGTLPDLPPARCRAAQVFEELKDVVGAVLSGYNGTIMAYGQTGSGEPASAASAEARRLAQLAGAALLPQTCAASTSVRRRQDAHPAGRHRSRGGARHHAARGG